MVKIWVMTVAPSLLYLPCKDKRKFHFLLALCSKFIKKSRYKQNFCFFFFQSLENFENSRLTHDLYREMQKSRNKSFGRRSTLFFCFVFFVLFFFCFILFVFVFFLFSGFIVMGDLSKYIKKENERLEGALKRMQKESECSKARSKGSEGSKARSKGESEGSKARSKGESEGLKAP